MADSSASPSIGSDLVFNPHLEHDTRESIVDLAQDVLTNCNEPFHVLSTLQQMLGSSPAYSRFDAQSLGLMLAPVVAQLDMLRCSACTLLWQLDPAAVQDVPLPSSNN